jgi:hypothetical protein
MASAQPREDQVHESQQSTQRAYVPRRPSSRVAAGPPRVHLRVVGGQKGGGIDHGSRGAGTSRNGATQRRVTDASRWPCWVTSGWPKRRSDPTSRRPRQPPLANAAICRWQPSRCPQISPPAPPPFSGTHTCRPDRNHPIADERFAAIRSGRRVSGSTTARISCTAWCSTETVLWCMSTTPRPCAGWGADSESISRRWPTLSCRGAVLRPGGGPAGRGGDGGVGVPGPAGR